MYANLSLWTSVISFTKWRHAVSLMWLLCVLLDHSVSEKPLTISWIIGRCRWYLLTTSASQTGMLTFRELRLPAHCMKRSLVLSAALMLLRTFAAVDMHCHFSPVFLFGLVQVHGFDTFSSIIVSQYALPSNVCLFWPLWFNLISCFLKCFFLGICRKGSFYSLSRFCAWGVPNIVHSAGLSVYIVHVFLQVIPQMQHLCNHPYADSHMHN